MRKKRKRNPKKRIGVRRIDMSHLSTIISRVRQKLDAYRGDISVFQDPIFVQAIRNLKEYQEAWKDFTPEEKKKADELFRIYHLPHSVVTDNEKINLLKKVI
jgi:hypothetical protein